VGSDDLHTKSENRVVRTYIDNDTHHDTTTRRIYADHSHQQNHEHVYDTTQTGTRRVYTDHTTQQLTPTRRSYTTTQEHQPLERTQTHEVREPIYQKSSEVVRL
jgi:hypothetical protein